MDGAEGVSKIAHGDIFLGCGEGERERELDWVIHSERGVMNVGWGDLDLVTLFGREKRMRVGGIHYLAYLVRTVCLSLVATGSMG